MARPRTKPPAVETRIGSALAAQIQARGLSLVAAAEEIGCDVGTLRKLLDGVRRPGEGLERGLSMFLGWTLLDLRRAREEDRPAVLAARKKIERP